MRPNRRNGNGDQPFKPFAVCTNWWQNRADWGQFWIRQPARGGRQESTGRCRKCLPCQRKKPADKCCQRAGGSGRYWARTNDLQLVEQSLQSRAKPEFPNDPPPLRCPHPRQHGLRHQEHRFQVDGQHLVPVLLCDLVERLQAGDSRVVYENGYWPKLAFDLRDHLGNLSGDGDVDLDGDGLATPASDLLASCFRLSIAYLVVHCHHGTGLRQCEGGGLANSATSTRDQGDLAVEEP